jgi:chemotaxis signal transduction protein
MPSGAGDQLRNPASFERPNSERAAKGEQFLLLAVSNQIFAISTSAVQEIRSTDSLAGTAREIDYPQIPWVRHTIKRNQRTYYVVNAALHFGLPMMRPGLVLILRSCRAAVLIDRIERMADISRMHRLPKAFAGEEQKWYRGLAYADDRVIPVIEPASFLSAEYIRSLDGHLQSSATEREVEGTVRA